MGARSEKLYRLYMEFFERGERRRWSPFSDVPWDRLGECERNPERALVAETFAGIELYLPDYVAQGLNLVREEFGQAWFMAAWGYEESRHGIALCEYLERSGQRTARELDSFRETLAARRWQIPVSTPRALAAYGMLQESTTLLSYRYEIAATERDPVLNAIYKLVARDEAAHANFYQEVYRVLLDEDRDGALADLASVVRAFDMPGPGLLPDYDARIAVVRAGGFGAGTFAREVVLPLLRRLGVRRRELRGALARRSAAGTSAAAPSATA